MASNTLLTISEITNEALRVLENNLTFAKHVTRTYDDRFANAGRKIGATLRIRKPPRYIVTDGAVLVVQDSVESEVEVTVAQHHVGMEFSSSDLTLDISDFSERFIAPAVAPLANRIDLDGLQLYKDVYNAVGVPGTVPNAMLTYGLAGARMSKEATPVDNMRALAIEPLAEATIVDAVKGLFHSSTEIERQYKEGTMGLSAGFKWNMDQNVGVQTAGTFTTGSTPVVAGAAQTGASLDTSGWAVSTLVLKKGDIFTIAGVNGVNPQSQQSWGELRQFVATADVTSDGSGLATIPISPSIVTSGAFQTVTASPADLAVITPMGTEDADSMENLAFHKDAFALVTVDLETPSGTDMAARVSDKQLGVSMRLIRDYVITTDQWPTRIDVMYGWVSQYPELACRVRG